MNRPYRNSRVEDLIELVATFADNREQLATVLHELSFRKTKMALNLQARVEGLLGSDSAVIRTSTPAPKEPLEGHGGTTLPAAASSPGSVDEDSELVHMRRLLEVLRNGITVRSERLDRWGMSCSVTPGLFEVVIKYWEAELSEVPDERGRTKSLLARELLEMSPLGANDSGVDYPRKRRESKAKNRLEKTKAQAS
jgi:hypothetical protein